MSAPKVAVSELGAAERLSAICGLDRTSRTERALTNVIG